MTRRRPSPVALTLLLAPALVLACGCISGPPVTPKTSMAGDLRELERDLYVLPPFPEPTPASGSLWTEAGPGAALVRDTRAFRTNDLVTIVLQEQSSGSNTADTDLNRSSAASFGVTNALGLEQASPRNGRFSLNQLLNTSSSSAFQGDGETGRSNRLDGSITTRVMRTLPNGDLVIGGQKVVMINRERQILTLVGTVRAVDVDARNRVPSTNVGDLTVRLWGHGEIDSTIRQGWFMRVLHKIWPF